jgi:molybdopterin molybdotransferase
MERVALETALELVLARVRPIRETIELPLSRALGLVAGEAVFAPLDNPPFDRSPLDGFALRSEDARAASKEGPVRLNVRGVVFSGAVFDGEIKPGEAAKIMTGAMIPPGCDCVVPFEQTREENGGVLIFEPLEHYQNYIFRGEDIQKGQILVPAGERLGCVHLAILAAMGLQTLKVLRPPKIGLLCTGDELSPAGKELPPGRIYESNGVLLSCRLRELGFNAEIFPVMADNAAAVSAEIARRMDTLDIFISTGGVGAGDRDIFHEVFKLLGAERLFWRMNFKPGGTVLCGVFREKLLLCLSGNPFACFTAFELLARPVLAALSSRSDLTTRRTRVLLKNSFPKKSGQRRFIRARIEGGKARLPEKSASGQLYSFLGCNGLLDIPAGTGVLEAGIEAEALIINMEPVTNW